MNKYVIFFILSASIALLQAQYTAIPDANFEQKLIDQGIDSEGILDGQVLTTDISSITDLSVNSGNIADLTGIADFSALETLFVHANNLNNLDVSNNTNLIVLNAYGNSLTNVNLPNSIEIAYLDYNNLIDVDLSNNLSLKDLDISGNPLESVNLENAISLEYLTLAGIDANLGDNLNINNCIQLKDILASAGLISIDLSTNIALEVFGGGMLHGGETDFLIEIDFSNNPNLQSFAYINPGSLERINLNNENNVVLTNVYIDLNDVACVQVDDAEAANNGIGVYANWSVPSSQVFSDDCFTVGLEEVISQNIDVFPNPTLGFVTANLMDYKIKSLYLFNQLGVQVAFFKTNTFDISHLSKGIYYIKIVDKNDKVYITKIIKE